MISMPVLDAVDEPCLRMVKFHNYLGKKQSIFSTNFVRWLIRKIVISNCGPNGYESNDDAAIYAVYAWYDYANVAYDGSIKFNGLKYDTKYV